MVQGAAPETSASPRTIGNSETTGNPPTTDNQETTGNREMTASSIEETRLKREYLNVPTAERMLLRKTQALSTATTARTVSSVCISTTSRATGLPTAVD